MRDFPLHTGLSILTTGALLFAIKLVPANVPPPENAAPRFGPAPAAAPASTPAPIVKAGTPPPLFDDSAGALDNFYRALARTEARDGGAVTRIVHYGDSPITADLITGDVRALLQARFGDAGHGFLLVDKPWAWYQHDRVKLSASGWKSSPASRFIAQDGFFGLGGVSSIGTAKSSTKITYQSPQTKFEL